jgi:hypothetical protein
MSPLAFLAEAGLEQPRKAGMARSTGGPVEIVYHLLGSAIRTAK